MKNLTKFETFIIISRAVVVALDRCMWIAVTLLGLYTGLILPSLPTFPYHPDWMYKFSLLVSLLLIMAVITKLLKCLCDFIVADIFYEHKFYDKAHHVLSFGLSSHLFEKYFDHVYNRPVTENYNNIPLDVVEQDKSTENAKQ